MIISIPGFSEHFVHETVPRQVAVDTGCSFPVRTVLPGCIMRVHGVAGDTNFRIARHVRKHLRFRDQIKKHSDHRHNWTDGHNSHNVSFCHWPQLLMVQVVESLFICFPSTKLNFIQNNFPCECISFSSIAFPLFTSAIAMPLYFLLILQLHMVINMCICYQEVTLNPGFTLPSSNIWANNGHKKTSAQKSYGGLGKQPICSLLILLHDFHFDQGEQFSHEGLDLIDNYWHSALPKTTHSDASASFLISIIWTAISFSAKPFFPMTSHTWLA